MRATNKKTFEVTKETHLTPRGDCIVAVSATKGAANLSSEFKKIASRQNARIIVTLEVEGKTETVKARGHPALSFTHPTDLVVRKSDYVCNRTLAIRADKAARDFSRSLVEKLRSPRQKVLITLIAEARAT